MGHRLRQLHATLTAALGLAALGCNEADFAQVNANLSQIQQAGLQNPDARLTTAATAAALAGMEVGKVLVPGAAAPASTPGAFRLLAWDPGVNKTQVIDANGVKGNVAYDSAVVPYGPTAGAGRALMMTVKNFEAQASGFTVKAKGGFYDVPAFSGVSATGLTFALMEVKLGYGGIQYDGVMILSTTSPLPANRDSIGFVLMWAVPPAPTSQYRLVSGNVGVKDGVITQKFATILATQPPQGTEGLPLEGIPVDLAKFR
ncbi:MAG: hypothetical protein VKS61_13040 [Candidatus Sericytochromatia bacterium]|nr:hypothetical protein [Candidatus Sericytochromatia bacterium]